MTKLILRPKRERRKLRIRAKVFGTAERPRLTVFRSVRYTYGQLIDDVAGKTLVDISDAVKKTHDGKKKAEAAFELGKMLGERAEKKGIKSAVFDRNGYRYHGRVQSLADGARKGGLHV